MNYNGRNHRLKCTVFIRTQAEFRAGVGLTDTTVESTKRYPATRDTG